MSELVETLRAIVRAELARVRGPELALVTAVGARETEDADHNHQVDLRLRDSGLELSGVPVAVGRVGLSLLPRVGDLVLVAFLKGDLNAPVVVGSLYDDVNRPPVAGPEEAVYEVPDAGASDIRRLHLALPGGTTVTLEDETVEIISGGTEVVVARDGDVTVRTAGRLSLEARGEIAVEAGGDLLLSAGSKVSIKGVTVSVEGQAGAKLKGATVSLAGITQFSPS